MAGRPYWSGQLKLSLVSFGIQLFPATVSQAKIALHQIDRTTGRRIRHLNVAEQEEQEPVASADIVKGYEYSKGNYVILEPDEIAKLRIPTKNVIEIVQFVNLTEITPALFEKPYFVVPEPKESPEAFAVVLQAMEQNNKAAIGEIAFAGREHLIAIAAPPKKSDLGMEAYVLRYSQELRDSAEYFSGRADLQSIQVDKRQLALANELIQAYSGPLNLDAFRDDYEVALRELIEAKQKNLPLPVEEEERRPAKVINLMDALRQSVTQAKRPAASSERKPAPKKGPARAGAARRKQKAA